MDLYDDETLMAFADGLLGEPMFSEIAAAIESDAELAMRIEQLVVGRDAARAVYGGLAAMMVPKRLVRAVERMAGLRGGRPASRATPRPSAPAGGGEVRALPALPPPRGRRGAGSHRSRRGDGRVVGNRMLVAAAAAAILVAGAAGYMIAGGGGAALHPEVGGRLSGAQLAALTTVASGQQRGVGEGLVMRMVATFEDAERRLCREFELDGNTATVAVACRDSDRWRVAFVMATPVAGDGYTPDAALEALDDYLAGIGASPPMSLDEERLALAATP